MSGTVASSGGSSGGTAGGPGDPSVPIDGGQGNSQGNLFPVAALQDSSGADVTSGTPTTFGNTGQIVTYTVPLTGMYDIEAIGASGGGGDFLQRWVGG